MLSYCPAATQDRLFLVAEADGVRLYSSAVAFVIDCNKYY